LAEGVRYRKLPGHRRGLFRGASVWLGPDHLLLVRSMRFREEYKRYQFRDIQAIVVAGTKRFHISTRAIGIAVLWFLAAVFLWTRAAWGPALMVVAAILLLAAWLIVSGFFSCQARIYTAVSRDDLPSLYRSWTARRFLREVESRIADAQGTVQGWAGEIEEREIGPAEQRPVTAAAAAGASPALKPALPRRNRTLASDFLIACLIGDAVWNSVAARAPQWLQSASHALALLLTVAAILVVVQHHRGTIATGMQRLAIGVLVAVGLIYYLRPMMVGMLIGASAGTGKQPMSAASLLTVAPWMRTVESAVTGLLGIAGLGIAFFGGKEEKVETIAPAP
jgi:hypothetical protein